MRVDLQKGGTCCLQLHWAHQKVVVDYAQEENSHACHRAELSSAISGEFSAKRNEYVPFSFGWCLMWNSWAGSGLESGDIGR